MTQIFSSKSKRIITKYFDNLIKRKRKLSIKKSGDRYYLICDGYKTKNYGN